VGKIYVALYREDSIKGKVEVDGGGYARTEVVFTKLVYESPNFGVASNRLKVQFPTATSPWGQVTSFTFFDAPTKGRILANSNSNPICGTLPNTYRIMTGDNFSFAVGGLVARMEGLARFQIFFNSSVEKNLRPWIPPPKKTNWKRLAENLGSPNAR